MGGLISAITAAIPTQGTLLQDLVAGAASTVVLNGLKSSAGLDAIDPLQIIHKDTPNNNPNAIVGPTITASAFAQLPATAQAQLTASGVHIVAG